jgi:hypothetical protein
MQQHRLEMPKITTVLLDKIVYKHMSRENRGYLVQQNQNLSIHSMGQKLSEIIAIIGFIIAIIGFPSCAPAEHLLLGTSWAPAHSYCYLLLPVVTLSLHRGTCTCCLRTLTPWRWMSASGTLHRSACGSCTGPPPQWSLGSIIVAHSTGEKEASAAAFLATATQLCHCCSTGGH